MIKHYLHIALRNLLKRPFYTTINILGLAIGMACTLLIAVYILQELSYDRFHEKADRIYRLATHLEVGESGFVGAAVSPAVAQPFKEETPAVEMVVRMNQEGSKIFRKDDLTIKEDKVLVADPDFFRLFSFPLLVGNPGGQQMLWGRGGSWADDTDGWAAFSDHRHHGTYATEFTLSLRHCVFFSIRPQK